MFERYSLHFVKLIYKWIIEKDSFFARNSKNILGQYLSFSQAFFFVNYNNLCYPKTNIYIFSFDTWNTYYLFFLSSLHYKAIVMRRSDEWFNNNQDHEILKILYKKHKENDGSLEVVNILWFPLRIS